MESIASIPHWHLLVNHFPTVGVVIGLALALFSARTKSDDLARTALALFVVLGLLALPTYVTGAAAALEIAEAPGVSPAAVDAHRDAALWAVGTLLLTAWVSWLALWLERRAESRTTWSLPTAAVLAVFSLLVMIRTGALGGEINHPELRFGDDPTTPGTTASIAAWVVGDPSRWPTLEALHFLGMSMLFGVVLLMALRVFGVGRAVSFPALHRLLPFGVFGFMINVGSGMLFFIADSDRYSAMKDGFFPKIGLIVAGGVTLLYLTISDDAWRLQSGENARASTKVVTALALVLWSAVIVYGRLLPYLEGGAG